jgi:RNA polymerase sigma-70 factor (ECF subfamily)
MYTAPNVTTKRESAFEREAIPYMRQLYPVALRLTHQPCDAEDLVQDTFTRAYLKFYQFTPGTNLRAWLYRVMLTTFYSCYRERSRRPAEMLALAPGQELAGQTTPAAKSAEAEALGDLGDSEAVHALAELPAAYKSVIYLADIENYRYGEIADVLGIPIGTVMSRAYRGRMMLRSKLSVERPAQALHTTRPALQMSARQKSASVAA